MKSNELRQKFIAFFKNRGHVILPSAPLLPENDPTVLFNTAGMQPLIPYLMGKEHPQGNKLANIQKCVRTTDIDDIGDKTHATFFEMMGNWSLGAYFKEEAIKWSFEFLTSKEEGLGLDPKRLYITVFEGLKNPDGTWQVPPDDEAKSIWVSLGIPEHRIYAKGVSANWWPAVKKGDTWTGPTGPCSEMFYDLTEEGLGDLSHQEYDLADEQQKVVEIWNDVFMQFEKREGVIVGELEKKNVDTGAGFERLCMVLQKKDNIFETDIFEKIISTIEAISTNSDLKAKRVVADHIRTAVMLVADGVFPSNTDQGYVLRRLIRQAVRCMDVLTIEPNSLIKIIDAVIETYEGIYPLNEKREHLISVITKEELKFREALIKALKEFEKVNTSDGLSGEEAFNLYQSFGLPIEITLDLAKKKGIEVDISGFEAKLKEHEEKSREGSVGRFKGGLADTSEMSVKYHTATHLLHQALRDVLGDVVSQKGSNITAERLRFDFAYPQKMTDEQKEQVENIVNQKIAEKLPVTNLVMPKKEAEESGALHFFSDKYGDEVSVYIIGNSLSDAYSKEFCGGPHVSNTSQLGQFKIEKEEAVSAGVRRIKATLK